MREIVHTIINFGAESGQTPLDQKRIRTVNLLNLIMGFFLVAGLSNYFFVGSGYPFLVNFSFCFVSVFSIFLNKLRRTTWAFIAYTLNVNAAVFFINQYYPTDAGAYLYYYALIISVVLLNNPHEPDKFSFLHFLICIVFFAANFTLNLHLYDTLYLTPEKIKIIWYYNLVISVFVTALMCIMVTRLIYSQNKEIVFQNQNLIKTKEAVDTSLKEKEVLLAELHHRVKNNLAIITGLLNLQEDASNDPEVKKVLTESKARIMSMALVHRMLYENSELKNINLGRYASELVSELFNSYNLIKKVKINLHCEDVLLPVNKSVPLGLILNEAVTNSIKYVFKPGATQHPEFSLSITQVKGMATLVIKDNGAGFPRDFNTQQSSPSLGIYLIKTLSEQIDGQIRFINNDGARIELIFSIT